MSTSDATQEAGSPSEQGGQVQVNAGPCSALVAAKIEGNISKGQRAPPAPPSRVDDNLVNRAVLLAISDNVECLKVERAASSFFSGQSY